MEKESNLEAQPILEGNTEEQSSPEKRNCKKQTFGSIIAGIICAFLWPFLGAVSVVCVQALENRSVLMIF